MSLSSQAKDEKNNMYSYHSPGLSIQQIRTITLFHAMLYFLMLFLSFTMSVQAQVRGCTDPLANNYNASATINDGSCIYQNINLTPEASINLPAVMRETSGLILDGDSLWTHNDDADINLYRFSVHDTAYTSFPLNGARNIEWEDMSADDNYFYVGDFGNNSSGNRKDLNILRVKKSDVYTGILKYDTIRFSYEDQTITGSSASNTTDFDCEAMIVLKDSIYLFSKMWTTQKSVIYALPKSPGTYVAQKRGMLDIGGLITGATAIEDKRLIILCGYSRILQPFLYLLYDYPGTAFTEGNKRKVGLSIPFHQIEGIATQDGLMVYCTNEKLVQSFLEVNQAMHRISLKQITSTYLQGGQTSVTDSDQTMKCFLSNGSSLILRNSVSMLGESFVLFNNAGQVLHEGIIDSIETHLSLSAFPTGTYTLLLRQQSYVFCIVK